MLSTVRRQYPAFVRAARLAGRSRTMATAVKPSTAYLEVTHPEDKPSAELQNELQTTSRFVLPVYARPPVIVTHGKGNYIYDSQEREYLDFTGGIAVNALGHADEQLAQVRDWSMSLSWDAKRDAACR